ncbi:MAG: NfeD family protein, partial [Acidimicrobiia bacterium]
MRTFLAALLLLATASSGAGPARAAAEPPARHIEVVQVEGAIDPVVADLIISALEGAEAAGAGVVILQIDSHGALDTDPGELIAAIRSSPVPVVAWVGPSGAAARGAAAVLVLE